MARRSTSRDSGADHPSRYGARYKAGHIVEDGRHLYVCRGIGTSHLPVRLGAPPEIALLTLRSADRGLA